MRALPNIGYDFHANLELNAISKNAPGNRVWTPENRTDGCEFTSYCGKGYLVYL